MTTAELTPTAAPAPESVPKTAPAPPARRLKRWRWSAQLLLTLSGRLTLALLLLLCVTQTGLRLLCAGAEALLPVQSLLPKGVFGDWQLRGLSVTLPAVTLRFGAVAMDWSLLTLVNGTLTINLGADEVEVTLPPSADDESPLQLPQLRLPFRLAVTQAIVNLQIATAGATRHRCGSISCCWQRLGTSTSSTPQSDGNCRNRRSLPASAVNSRSRRIIRWR
ncbi:hypothetical protein [Chromatium okenii]|uniref:Uncharacterized protein n=1 Tax=Chromatium okenii TaxID=61644 RepID=A0A2S7XST2_9GAMM|nr:hypothetical protein [Chromatium okenii]PQJ96451.1 hypothetical protein CXB77_06240 [Chromatium okenii]